MAGWPPLRAPHDRQEASDQARALSTRLSSRLRSARRSVALCRTDRPTRSRLSFALAVGDRTDGWCSVGPFPPCALAPLTLERKTRGRRAQWARPWSEPAGIPKRASSEPEGSWPGRPLALGTHKRISRDLSISKVPFVVPSDEPKAARQVNRKGRDEPVLHLPARACPERR